MIFINAFIIFIMSNFSLSNSHNHIYKKNIQTYTIIEFIVNMQQQRTFQQNDYKKNG